MQGRFGSGGTHSALCCSLAVSGRARRYLQLSDGRLRMFSALRRSVFLLFEKGISKTAPR